MTALLSEVLAHPTGRLALCWTLVVLGAWLRVDGLRFLAGLPRWRVTRVDPAWRRG